MSDSPAPGTLAAGTRLSHYEIATLIGAGGMGHVYQARDTKLQRDVALKLLPADVAGDPERRQRFEREARAVAALNHPGIVTIYSVDEVDGRVFLTMELVSGRTLSEAIPRAGLPVDRLLALAVPLMDAVSAAHARGITHRDLKPANVMVTADAHVKVLDFGLAKPSDAVNTSATVTEAPDVITGQGRILGTIAYMSPEQAEGKPVDARSDVFSLGVMLYEMATGIRPFKGDTSLSTLTAIMRDSPRPVTEVNGAVPKEVWRVIRRALAKDPDRRQQSAKDLRNELEELRRDLESGELIAPIVTATSAAPGGARPPSSVDAFPSSNAPAAPPSSGSVLQPSAPAPGVPRWALAAVAVVLIAGAAAALRLWPAGNAATDATKSRVTVESVVSLTGEDGLELFPSLSPDGKWLVYAGSGGGVGASDILLRAVGGQTVINLTKDSPQNDTQPAFSPDGERIAFRSDRDGGGIFVMGRTGESVRRVTSDGFNPSWSPDGQTLAYVTEPVGQQPYGRNIRSRLWTVALKGGEPRQLQTVEDAMQPAWSPDGSRIVYWGLQGDSVQRDLWTVAASGGEPVRLTNDRAVDWSPIWAPDSGHVYYSSDGTGQLNLWRIAIDAATGAPRGAPEPVTLPRQGVGQLSLAENGTMLAAVSFGTKNNIELLTLDSAAGKVTGRRRVTNISETASNPSSSADGEWIAFYRNTNGQEDIWVVKRDGSGLRQVTNDAAHDRNPQFWPDGRHILYYSDRGGRYQVWTMGLDGGNQRQLTDEPGLAIGPRMTRDGTRAFANVPLARQHFLFDPRLSAADQKVERLPTFPGSAVFTATSWSPDGRFIAGHRLSTRGGIFVYDVSRREFRELAAEGTNAVWMSNGRHILFRSLTGALGDAGAALELLDTQTSATRRVFSVDREDIGGLDVSADGRQIAAVIIDRQADIVLAKLATR